MTSIDATPAERMNEKVMTVKMSKVTEGIGMVFTGVLTMLEAIDTTSAKRLAEITVKEKTEIEGNENVQNETADAGQEAADGGSDAPSDGVRDADPDGNEVEEADVAAPEKAAEEEAAAQAGDGKAVPGVTQDDITRVIVRKIKQDRANSGKISSILKTYGASKVSELPEDKYEAFLTDISAV